MGHRLSAGVSYGVARLVPLIQTNGVFKVHAELYMSGNTDLLCASLFTTHVV